MFKDKDSKSYYLHSFLLGIAIPLRAYIKNNNLYELAGHFAASYIKNYFFNNNYFYTAQTDVPEEVMLELTSALFQQLNNLDCCPSHDMHYEEHTLGELKNYISKLLDYIDACQILARLSHLPKEFHEDYAITYNNLIQGNIDLAEAKKSMLHWEGAIADDTMQEILFLMCYSYLKHLKAQMIGQAF